MRHFRRTLVRLAPLLAVASFGLTGCGGGSTINQPKQLTKLPNPGFKMQVIWHTNAGDGAGPYVSGFRPAVANSRVYVANHDGRVVALNLNNGHRLWRADTDKHLISGPTVIDGTLLVGTRNGEVLALSAQDGSQEWSADLSSEVIAAPAGNANTVIARTVDGHIAALDMHTGKRIWTVDGSEPNLTIRGNGSPQIRGDTVYVGMDSGRLLALDMATGEQRWSQTIAVPNGQSELARIVDVDANPLIYNNTIDAASAGNSLMSMKLSDGQVLWKQKIASVKNLAVDSEHLYVTDMNSVVHAVSKASGQPVWQQDALEYRRLTAPAVVDGYVLVGDYQGYLDWLSPSDGSIQGRGRPFGSAIRAQPVVVGDQAIVLGADGEVAAVRFDPSH